MSEPLRVAFFGTPEAAVPTLEMLAETTEVVIVVTQPDRPQGRSRKTQPPPVKMSAQRLGLPVAQPERSAEIAPILRACEPLDVAVLVAFGQLIRPEALGIPRRGFLNVHFSVLPRWRGAAPVQRAIMAGDERLGITIMVLDAGLDTGPSVATWSTALGPGESGGAVLERMATRGGELTASVLRPYVEGSLAPTPQPGEGVVAAKLTSDDRVLDWGRPALELVRQIRALAPRPGASTSFQGQPLKVLWAELEPGASEPGLLEGVRVGTGDGVLRLVTVQPAGKRAMSADDWLRGITGQAKRLG